tara:strand:- start:520 stop:1152 length:633 start_codon:yes stop_codon:yes gene_type:complete
MSNTAAILEQDSLEHYSYIGHYLKALREHYGLSYQDVTDQLRIRAKYVEAMEEGQLEALPGKVYTLGYLQTYAEFLGVDPHAAATHFEKSHGSPKQERAFIVAEPPAPAPYPSWLVKSLAAAGVLFLFGIGVYHYARHVEHTVEPTSVEAVPTRLLSVPAQAYDWVNDSSCGLGVNAAAWPACFANWRYAGPDILPAAVSHPLFYPALAQ